MSHIRLMQKQDIEEVAVIEKSIFSTPWSANGFLEAICAENTLFLVAEETEGISGYIGIYLAADEGEITNVAVKEQCRRKHIGEDLIKEAMHITVQRGIEIWVLEVRISNEAAIALYQRIGFVIKGLRKGFYEKPKEDAYVMVYSPSISTIQAQ